MTYQEQRTLEQVKLQLTEWRLSNGAPTPIPSEIWDTAVHLAGRYGVSTIARALRLDYGSLKKRLAVESGPQDAPTTTFVELLAPPTPTAIPRCVIEIESAKAQQLRVRLTEVTPDALASIIRQVLA